MKPYVFATLVHIYIYIYPDTYSITLCCVWMVTLCPSTVSLRFIFASFFRFFFMKIQGDLERKVWEREREKGAHGAKDHGQEPNPGRCGKH